MKITIKNILSIFLLCSIVVLSNTSFKANAEPQNTVNKTLKQGSTITIKNTTSRDLYINTNATHSNDSLRFNYYIKDSSNYIRKFKVNQSENIYLEANCTVELDLFSGDNLLLSIPAELIPTTTIVNTTMIQEVNIPPSETYLATNNRNQLSPILTINSLNPNTVTLDSSNYSNGKLYTYTPEAYTKELSVYSSSTLKIRNTSSNQLKLYYLTNSITFSKSSESTSKDLLINSGESYIFENTNTTAQYLYPSINNSSSSYFDAVKYDENGNIIDVLTNLDSTTSLYLTSKEKLKVTCSNNKVKFSYPIESKFNITKTNIPAVTTVQLKKGQNLKINISSLKNFYLAFKILKDDVVSYDYSIIDSSKTSTLISNSNSDVKPYFNYGNYEVYVTLNEGELLDVLLPSELTPKYEYTNTKAIINCKVGYNKTTEIDTTGFNYQIFNLYLPNNNTLDMITIPNNTNENVGIKNFKEQTNLRTHLLGNSKLSFSLTSPGEMTIPILGLLENKIKYYDRPALKKYTIPAKGTIDIINLNTPKTAVQLNELKNNFNLFFYIFNNTGDLNSFYSIPSTNAQSNNFSINEKMRIQNTSTIYPISISMPYDSNVTITTTTTELPKEITLKPGENFSFTNINKKTVITSATTSVYYAYRITDTKGNEYSSYKSNSSLPIPANYSVTLSAITDPVTIYIPSYIFGPSIEYDINKDKNIDMLDMAYISSKYNLTSDNPNYSSDCDLILDRKIDIYDLCEISKYLN